MTGNKSRHILTFLFVCVGATTLHANPCGDQAFFDSLGQSESGGCGTNQYDCIGPIINNGGMHHGDTPLGKYQFMPKTLESMGIDPTNFVGNAAAQEAAIQQFVAMNDACLQRQGAYDHIGQVVDGVTITKSGLLGAAHLGGCGGAAKWAKGQGDVSDQLGTSLANYAAKFGGYGVMGASAAADGSCGTGVANAAQEFARAQAAGLHIIGCDPRVLEKGKINNEALQQTSAEIAKQIIQPPVPIEQMTCIDQNLKRIDAAGSLHANPGGTLSNAAAGFSTGGLMPRFDEIVTNNVVNGLQSAIAIPGAISTEINTIWTDISSAFGDPASVLGGLLGGGPSAPASANCTVMEDTWLLNQCVDIGPLPNLTDIVTNKIGEISGAIASLPNRAIQNVCEAANTALGGFTNSVNNIDNVFEDAVDESFRPITDSVNNANTNATGAIQAIQLP